MPYASDKLKDGFIRQNKSRFALELKARDMLLHLRCLTTTDSEEVDATCTRLGNTYAMYQLLENLVRRENWPEDFIRALDKCEHPALAQEVRDAYEALKQPRNQKQKPVAPSVRSASVDSSHVHPASPVLSPPAHPPFSSLPPQPAAHSAPLPTSSSSSSSRSELPPSRSPELQLRPQVPPAAFIHPNATNRPAMPPSVAASPAPAPAPSMVPPAAVPPAHSPLAAPVAMVLQSEGAQAPRFGVPPDSGISGAHILTGVPPAEIPEPQSAMPGPQAPYTYSPELPQTTRIPVQETSSPSCKVNPLHQQPEETSDPTLNRVRTHQHPIASPENPVVCLPPPAAQNITPPAQASATVSTRVIASAHHSPPPPADMDTEEEYFSKPGVLQSVNEEPVTVIQPPEPCSLTSDDLEISRPAGDSASDAHAQVSTRVNTNECPEPVQLSEACSVTSNDLEFSAARNLPLSHQVSNPADVERTRGPVNSHNSGRPDSAFSPRQVPVEDHFESARSNSEDQGTEELLIHFSQEPSIQNYDGNVVSHQESSVVDRSDTQQQQQPTTNQHTLTQSTLAQTEVGAEKSEKKSRGAESGHQEKGAGNREERREASRADLLPALHNVPVFPTAAIVIGVCALVFAWRLRK